MPLNVNLLQNYILQKIKRLSSFSAEYLNDHESKYKEYKEVDPFCQNIPS